MPGIFLLIGLYGIGSSFQKTESRLNVAPAQLIASNRKIEAAQTKPEAQVLSGNGVQTATQSGNFNAPANTRTTQTAVNLPIKSAAPQTAATAEKVYFCGAPTKKGTMCSRRVKNGGRCWQHQGQAALLSQEKLLAVQN